MQLDIFSDTICPWCFIGKRRLERALAERPQEGLSIRWRAFQLNPGMPSEGMDRKLYLETKFGGPEGAARVYGSIAEAGRSEGIDFNFDGISHTPNTILSHRLIRWAWDKQAQDALVERLFKAYFLEGQNIGEVDTLVSLSEEIGLNSEEVSDFLQSSLHDAEVRAEDQEGRQAGITGVPCYVFGGRYALPGAQPPEALFQLFDVMRQDKEAETAAE